MDAANAKTWDAIYAKHGGRHWPCEPLVSFVRRVYGPLPPEVRRGLRAVELGSGIGNNLWFLLDEGFQVAGIEPSTEARRLCAEYLMLRQAGGYALESRPWPPWRREFDLVVDVTTLQHLSERNHRAALEWIQNVLVPGGRLWSLRLGEGTDYTELFPGNPPVWLGSITAITAQVIGAGFSACDITRLEREYPGNLWARYLCVEART